MASSSKALKTLALNRREFESGNVMINETGNINDGKTFITAVNNAKILIIIRPGVDLLSKMLRISA